MNVSGLSSSAGLYAAAFSRGQNAAESSAKTPTASSQQSLTPDEQKQVERLKARDRVVRQHEQAHMTAGAGLITSAASFTYQRGPDGVNYAIGGEVSIDTSPGRTPDETIDKAQRIRAAALAPAEPSGQDRAVAAAASQMAQAAQMEKAKQERSGGQDASGENTLTQRLSQIYNPDANSAGQIIQAYA